MFIVMVMVGILLATGRGESYVSVLCVDDDPTVGVWCGHHQ